MNEHEQDPSLDPDQDARIRALLADLGTAPGATSMPPEVAARLDDTLARLVAEREEAVDESPEESHSNVVPIRRRWATRAAGAAAAVIVVGAGGVAVANLGVFGGSTANDSTAGGASSKAESLDNSATPPASSPGDQAVVPGTRSLPSLSAASFDADVALLLRGREANLAALADTADSLGRTETGKAQQDTLANRRQLSQCSGPEVTDGALPAPVRYDDKVAVLLVHPARQGDRLVEVWTCSGDRKLNSVSVPVTHETSGQSSPANPGLGSPSPTP